ncbi:hypothetical protein SAMN06297129_2214 [Pseudooceanicola antarcticus]|uniref:PRC-barrel domain-containing protein n=1 Tax=Pseudooceanicola antarcticus TaxID=1247613 RepID=A0A285IW18_9RHOB|nr:hypothetical protein [Pseudooceanicola antarcticus]PJE25980.1 hypothetical protein CVM39_19995 [Pseudooceanicola antarcticus]SNY52184.1 hypothetical protein SAMN06297129_2214 [Pseudooceanicola antarcticus]
MRKAMIIPAIAAASLTAIPAFAYEGPVASVTADVAEASVAEGKVPAPYLPRVSDDVETAMMKYLPEPVEGGEGISIEASVLGVDLSPNMGTMSAQVAVFGQNGDIITTFPVELEADTAYDGTDPEIYYGPMVDKFAEIAADKVMALPIMDGKLVEGEAPKGNDDDAMDAEEEGETES